MQIEKVLEQLLQTIDITAAGVDNLLPSALKQQGIEDMLGGQIFMPPSLRFANRQGKSYLDILIKHLKPPFLTIFQEPPVSGKLDVNPQAVRAANDIHLRVF
jgi:hypothetical protein